MCLLSESSFAHWHTLGSTYCTVHFSVPSLDPSNVSQNSEAIVTSGLQTLWASSLSRSAIPCKRKDLDPYLGHMCMGFVISCSSLINIPQELQVHRPHVHIVHPGYNALDHLVWPQFQFTWLHIIYHVLTALKTASIILTVKKQTLDTRYYQLVLIHSCLSKILDHAAYNQVSDYLTQNELDSTQSDLHRNRPTVHIWHERNKELSYPNRDNLHQPVDLSQWPTGKLDAW